jgi:hypothetical protein
MCAYDRFADFSVSGRRRARPWWDVNVVTLVVEDLVEQYVALWNDPDPARRRETIRELWAARGEQLLQPPHAMQEAAHAIGFNLDALAARGYAELETRVSRAYAEFVAPGQYVFRRRDTPTRVANVVKFRWEMVQQADGQVAAVGLEFLVLDPEDRIISDYQFIES